MVTSSSAEPSAALVRAGAVLSAQQSFLHGQDWAWASGIIAVLLGAVLVFVAFPSGPDEKRLFAEYRAADQVRAASVRAES